MSETSNEQPILDNNSQPRQSRNRGVQQQVNQLRVCENYPGRI